MTDKDLVMKKKVMIIVLLIVGIVCMSIALPESEEYDYLRIHIRANSNTTADQNVKYKVKDTLVEYLTPYLCNVPSKEEAIDIIEDLTPTLTGVCQKVLREEGFNYSVNIKINNEYFPTRTYSNTTLESGYYDAVIVELGDAVGDNWWCVMYPPLCFVNKNENSMQIKYKSKILEWILSLFN